MTPIPWSLAPSDNGLISTSPTILTQLPGLEVQGLFVAEASGVVGDVFVGEEALEERFESALGSGISSGIDQRPLMCSNSCT